MNIGASIKTLRKSKGINQGAMSKRLGITQPYLSQIERGHKDPSPSMLNSIAIELHTPLAILIWMGTDRSDIAKDKQQVYDTLKPSIDALLNGLI